MRRGGSGARRGVALVMVLVVLAALLIVGVPFVWRMRLVERSARGFEAERRAALLAASGREIAIAALARTHPDRERERAEADSRLGDSGEDWDAPDELELEITSLPGAEPARLDDPRGDRVSVEVEDEQGKLHLDGAGALALMNLVGVWALAEPLDEHATELVLEDARGLFSDGDPETVDGLLRVGRELLAYRDVQDRRVRGLERAVYFSALRLEHRRHRAGALVHDARGWKLALHPFWTAPGRYRPFETVAAVREIARWPALLPGLVGLEARGVSVERMEQLGLGAQALEGLAGRGRWAAARAALGLGVRAQQPPPAAGSKKPVRPLLEGAQGRAEARRQLEVAARLADAPDLEAFSARELERLRPDLTVWSRRPAVWTGGALVRNRLEPDPRRVHSTLQLGVVLPEAVEGAAARVEGTGGVEYRQIVSVGNNRRRLVLFPQLEGSYDAATARVWVAPFAPVNVNTASRAVLAACMTGLRLRGQREPAISPAQARAVAARLAAAPVRDPGELSDRLAAAVAAGEIEADGALAIWANALDPGWRGLGSRTVPFTFETGNVYTVTSFAAVGDRAGGERARRVQREVVAVAPARPLVWNVDSQDHFAVSLALAGPAGRRGPLRRPGRRGAFVQTLPVPPRQVGSAVAGAWFDRSHEPGRGRLRLATGRVAEWTGGRGLVRHFDEQPDGQPLEASGYALGGSAWPQTPDPFGTWPRPILGPGWFEVWLRPQATGDFVVFDVGEQAETDRLVLRYDAAAGELVFEAWDAALPEPAPGGASRPCARLRAPWRPEPDRWYHLAACWQGSRPGQLALFVDGLAVGRAEAADGMWRLGAGIDALADRIPLEDATGLPTSGAVQVGTEVVEYDGIEGNALRVVDRPPAAGSTPQGPRPPTGRGARGSLARAHAPRTPVRRWGYTNFFLTDLGGLLRVLSVVAQATGVALPRELPVRRGGGRLRYPLPAETPMVTLLPEDGEDAVLPNDARRIPTAPGGPTLAALGFPPHGFVQIRHEVLYYGRLGPHSFEDCVRRVYGWFDNDVVTVPDPNTPGGTIELEGYLAYTPVVLASIELTDVSDYEDFNAPGQSSASNPVRGWWYAIDGEWLRGFQARHVPNPETGALDPRWRNIVITADAPADLSSNARAAFRGRTNAVGFDDERWPRADGWQPGGAAKYAALLAQLERSQGGPFPGASTAPPGANPDDRRPDHIHLGMVWARGLWEPDTPGVSPRAHAAGAVVLPVHGLTRPYTGAGDHVTMLEADAPRLAFVVQRAARAAVLSAALGQRTLPFWLCTFDRELPAGRSWSADRGLRLVQRPSGVLPLLETFAGRVGAPAVADAGGGALRGEIDELRVGTDAAAAQRLVQIANAVGARRPGRSGRRILAPSAEPVPPMFGTPLHQAMWEAAPLRDPLDTAAAAQSMSAAARAAALDPGWQSWARVRLGDGAALVRIDGELVGIGRREGAQLGELARGALGSQPAEHSDEASWYVLPFPPVARLAGGFDGAGGRWIPVTALRPARAAFAAPGLLALDRGGGAGIEELLPYERLARAGFERPEDELGRGAYRGAYGTSRTAALSEGRLVYGFPFRYHDRHDPRVESDAGCFFQTAFTPGGGEAGLPCRFLRVDWEADLRAGRVDAGVRVLVRIDGRPAWNTEPTNRPGGLWQFDDPRDPNRIDAVGYTIELRVVMPFRPGAYARGAWKDSPVLDRLRVEYVRPAEVLHAERVR